MPLDRNPAFGQPLQGFRKGHVFLHLDACMQGGGGVVIQNRDNLLENDRPRIRAFIHKMHRTTGDLRPVVERLFPRLRPREGGKKGGMDVHNPVPIRLQHPLFKDAHEPGQGHDIGPMMRETRQVTRFSLAIKFVPEGRRAHKLSGHPVAPGAVENGSRLDIRQDTYHPGMKPPLRHGIQDRLGIAAVAGTQNGDFQRRALIHERHHRAPKPA